jgi:hypothetical protein
MFQHAGIWQAGSHPPQIYGDYKFLGEIIWNMHAGSWGREGQQNTTNKKHSWKNSLLIHTLKICVCLPFILSKEDLYTQSISQNVVFARCVTYFL